MFKGFFQSKSAKNLRGWESGSGVADTCAKKTVHIDGGMSKCVRGAQTWGVRTPNGMSENFVISKNLPCSDTCQVMTES